jgi:small-conductance mechanosensitive channel
MFSSSPHIMTAVFIPRFCKTHEENVMDQKQELKKKLDEIDRQILEAEKHLPAHSVKPPIMQEIFELEDQREAILAQLKELEAK